ncbi:polyketide synthase, putative [Methanotorris formicicus Mc-S-70]|uniref:Polyketide synthase, putative n=1 Tax=Methanotorris formicicus Mc-S-70 TaxID=647171 RepID=H1L1V2_9EURY|nr:polyketide synthase, putative [Methanotorris formicicus Mc-S-70]
MINEVNSDDLIVNTDEYAIYDGLNVNRTFASIFEYNDIAFMIRYFYHNILLFFE